MSKIKFIHYLISIFISIHIHHSSLVNGQNDGGVEENTPQPTPRPSPAPTTEFPKSYLQIILYVRFASPLPNIRMTRILYTVLSFSMQLLMDGARFTENFAKDGIQGKYTLDALFRHVLCVYIFGFESIQCGDLDDTLTILSPDPTSSPTFEPTYDPTADPTIGIMI